MNQQAILVINCGSSSVKFALYQLLTDQHLLLSHGTAEYLNQPEAHITISASGVTEQYISELNNKSAKPHAIVVDFILSFLEGQFKLSSNLIGIGHRVVHGGQIFNKSAIINKQVVDQIRACIPLAPLHNPANILGITTLAERFPNIPQAAVFDTAFHQSMPKVAYTYALPKQLCKDEGIRRYGFHGTSHRYITIQAAKYLKKPADKSNLVIAHLGNGASVCAVANGKSVDTSMGMTPLEGLVMGTRSGDVDPGIFSYLISINYSPEAIDSMLNTKSGLLGISGESNDMREICQLAKEGNEDAQLAIDVFCFRLAKYISAMLVSLKRLDALVITGGIGENSNLIREKTIQHLSILNFEIDTNLNSTINLNETPHGSTIHSKGSEVILVIPTNEELMIAQDTINLI